MHREGHIGIGLLVYAPIAFLLSYVELLEPMILGMVAVVFFSYAPDFDLQMPLVSHRGITHTVVSAVAAGVASAGVAIYLVDTGVGGSGAFVIRSSLLALVAAAGFGFLVGFVGVLSHLLGDVLTPMGITPYYPFSRRSYSLELVYASNEFANKALSLLGAIAFIAAIVGGVWLRTGQVGL